MMSGILEKILSRTWSGKEKISAHLFLESRASFFKKKAASKEKKQGNRSVAIAERPAIGRDRKEKEAASSAQNRRFVLSVMQNFKTKRMAHRARATSQRIAS